MDGAHRRPDLDALGVMCTHACVCARVYECVCVCVRM